MTKSKHDHNINSGNIPKKPNLHPIPTKIIITTIHGSKTQSILHSFPNSEIQTQKHTNSVPVNQITNFTTRKYLTSRSK